MGDRDVGKKRKALGGMFLVWSRKSTVDGAENMSTPFFRLTAVSAFVCSENFDTEC